MLVLVVGYQKSGKSAARLLKRKGYKVAVVQDDRTCDKSKIDRLINNLSFIVVSPGVPPNSPIIKSAKKQGIPIIGELELGYKYLNGQLIAVTGTNGKTTTTSMIVHLLGQENVFVAGNIGTPLSEVCEQTTNSSKCVCEVSSFQLMHTSKFRPHIAAFLNLTPDHLNYHKTMKAYLKAKLKIFKKQTNKDFAVLNADDKTCLQLKNIKSKIYYFSTKKRVNGCFIRGGNIYFKDAYKNQKAIKIAKTSDIHLIGEHNLSNALCAITCAILSGESPDIIAQRLSSFKPVEHRLEFVDSINQIDFINDSKATNTLSTICAIKSMKKPTTLILGGSDKGCEFDDIFKTKSFVSSYVLMGETQHKLAQAAQRNKKNNYVFADCLSTAVEMAYRLTPNGGTVLFSPACASFDMFENFEQRGKCFCGIVRELKKSENSRIKSIKKTKV